MKSIPPNPSIPKLWCDFNAQGWSGDPGDNCYYAFDNERLAELDPKEGLLLFAYMDDLKDEIVGCEVHLETFGDSWRLRPNEETWFSGRLN
jgi:hypothetical protein